VGDFGRALFTVHLLPFEVTALILMVAVIGVITLGDLTPQAEPRAERAKADRAMREAILREGKG
ncbi:MAG: NADH-quinone oxidoreductase subunit J, partial [Candidatus Baltobacteraceae bacterium]